jgi:hypothetical protein
VRASSQQRSLTDIIVQVRAALLTRSHHHSVSSSLGLIIHVHGATSPRANQVARLRRL